MLKMAVYLEANVILGSSLSPNNYCICKATAIANGADINKINSIVINAANNRLLPVSALQPTIVTYTIRFLDWDGTVLKTESVAAGNNPTPPANPTREGYTFNGWSPTIGAASQNQDYTATYTENGSGYTIIFAENRTADAGIYFIMNNGSAVPVANKNSISSSNVTGIAYLAISPLDSFLIDTVESDQINFGRPNVQNEDEAQAIYDTNGLHGKDTTNILKLNQRIDYPMPSIQWCNQRGNDWYIPSNSELHTLAPFIPDINEAMSFIGGTPLIQLSIDVYVGSSDNPYEPTAGYSYWTITYEDYNLTNVTCVEFFKATVHSQDGTTINDYYGQGYFNATGINNKVRLLKSINIGAPATPRDTIYDTQTVPAGVTPTPPTVTKPGWIFSNWYPALYPANKDEVYAASWNEAPSGGGDEPTPTPAGSLGRYGFGTDVDGEDKGQFFRIDGIGTYDYGDVVLNITLKKYVNESVTSTTTGTITLHNWRSSIQPSITISSSLQSAGLVDLGTTTSTGQAIVEIGSSDRVLDESTRTYGPPRGTHYVMDISTNNSITYSNEHSYSIEGRGTVNYYSRLHIPRA